MAQELKRFDIVGKYSDEDTRYEFRPDGECYDADEVDAVLAEKDAEIAELKKALEHSNAELESYFIFEKEIKAELRATKRSLWMHRAITAKLNKECCKAMRGYNPFIGIEEYTWQEVERKCRAKAEEYK